jgi:hypothetical protein
MLSQVASSVKSAAIPWRRGRVARFQFADRLGVLQRLEPSFHALKPQVEVPIPRHSVFLPERPVPCPVCRVDQSATPGGDDRLNPARVERRLRSPYGSFSSKFSAL